ncbi:MAG: hypothetical protein AAF668_10610 [Pseudomonadota bacterium]
MTVGNASRGLFQASIVHRAWQRLQSPADEWPGKAIAAVCVLISAYVAITTIGVVIFTHSDLLYWDQWERVTTQQLIDRIFHQHNEHRLFFPSLFFIADTGLFGGRNWFLNASSVSIQLAHSALLTIIIAKAKMPKWVIASFGGLALAATLSAAQIVNLTWGFQVQFVLVFLTGSSAFWLATDPRERIFATAAMMSISAFSLSAGVMTLAITPFAAFAAGRSMRFIGILSVWGMVMGGLFFWGYASPAHHEYASITDDFLAIVQFAAIYLGAPIAGGLIDAVGIVRTSEGMKAFAGVVGGSALVLYGALSIFLLTRLVRRQWLDRVTTTFACIAGMIVLAAFATGVGRAVMSIDIAFSSRYATPSMLFWVGLVGLLFSLVGQRKLQELIAFGAVFIAIAAASQDGHGRRLAFDRHDRLNNAYAALLSGVDDDAVLQNAYSSTATVKQQADLLREKSIGIFGMDIAAWRGQQLARHALLADEAECLGHVDQVQTLAGGALVADGWAWDVAARKGVETIFITDADNTIIGFGKRTTRRRDVEKAIASVLDVRTGWTAFSNSTDALGGNAYALLKNGRACGLIGDLSL